jgi:ornithine cyclodeaminase
LAEDYSRWPEFEHQPRLAHHAEVDSVPVGVVELMPITDGKTFTFKYVNGHPRNTDVGKLNVVAFGALADVATGYPQMIAEMTLLTALRTAATSALAAKHSIKQGATKQAIIGTGAQAEFQVIALATVCGLNDVTYYDKSPEAMEKFALNMARYGHIRCTATDSVDAAVRGAHVVTTATATKGRTEIIPPQFVEPGMHFNAIGGDCPGKTEFSADVLQQCKIVVEHEPQTRIEGEIQQLPASYPVTALWKLVRGEAELRTSTDDITLFDSVGYALEDFSVLRLVLQLARQKFVGREIAILPELRDPRDLFGMLA